MPKKIQLMITEEIKHTSYRMNPSARGALVGSATCVFLEDDDKSRVLLRELMPYHDDKLRGAYINRFVSIDAKGALFMLPYQPMDDRIVLDIDQLLIKEVRVDYTQAPLLTYLKSLFR